MTKIIIDADFGVDDSFAVLLANSCKEIEIQAITTVEGNCKLKYALENAFKILDFTKRNDIPVYKGEAMPLKVSPIYCEYVHGKNGLGDVEYEKIDRKIEEYNAVDYLIKAVNENPNKIIIAALGPLTNIALAAKKDPNFAKNVKQLVLMGGAEGCGNITPYAEFNFYRDPHAAKMVFEAGFKDIVILGFDVTKELPLTEKFENMLLEINSELSNFLYKASRIGAAFDRSEGTTGFIVNDALVIAYLMDSSIVKLKEVNTSVIIDGEMIGKSVINYNEKINSRIAYDVDVDKFYRLLFTNIFNQNKEIVDKYL